MPTSYFLPEWSPVKSILMAWPYPGSDWQANLPAAQNCYLEMLGAFTQVVDVWILIHPSINAAEFNQLLTGADIDLGRVHIETNILYDDTWTRDYGPLSCSSGYIQFGFNGWGGKYSAPHDNAVPEKLQHLLGQVPVDAGFICEGGGLETNGAVLLVNQDCIVDDLRNPRWDACEVGTRLQHWLGVTEIEWLSGIQLSGDDTDGHIDTIARFVGRDIVIYAGRNAKHPDSEALLSLHNQLHAIADRRNWTLYELPTPEFHSRIDGRVLPATYANFLICNQHIFVPVYGVEDDKQALEIISQACAGYKIVPVRCEALLEQHGSLHCATMQIIDLNKIEAE